MKMLEKLLLPEVRELIEGQDRETLRELVKRWLPADVGDLVTDLEPHERTVVLECLEPDALAATFVHLPGPIQEDLVRVLDEPTLGRILNELAPDDRTALLEDLPSEEVE